MKIKRDQKGRTGPRDWNWGGGFMRAGQQPTQETVWMDYRRGNVNEAAGELGRTDASKPGR